MQNMILLASFLLVGVTNAFTISHSRQITNTIPSTRLYSNDNKNMENDKGNNSSRRNMFKYIGAGIAATYITASSSTVQPSYALDMDAFINKELEVDKTKTEVSEDAKTCRYGAPGREKGDACVRAGMSVDGKNGGVNAYGELDRGDFVRCKTSYPMVDGQYVKTVTCK